MTVTMGAIFLDRDGVLNEDQPDYVRSWAQFRWLPGSLAALAALSKLKAPIIVITNQSMVGRGLATAHALSEIHQRMLCDLSGAGGRIDAMYCCPHAPEANCVCRKPRPALLHQAAGDFEIDLNASVFVGDAFTDYQTALAVGMRYIHVLSGRGAAALPLFATLNGVDVVDNLLTAVPLCASRLVNLPTPIAAG